MKKTIVYYFSKSGNNKYIAEKIAKDLNCEVEAIEPKFNIFPVHIFTTLLNIGCRLKSLKNKPSDFDRVIICSPIWMGHLISPVRGFINKYKDEVEEMAYVTICGSGDDDRDGKFGHDHVFSVARKVSDGKIKLTQALSLKLLRKNGEPISDEDMMKVRVDDELFNGEIKKRYDEFISKLKK